MFPWIKFDYASYKDWLVTIGTQDNAYKQHIFSSVRQIGTFWQQGLLPPRGCANPSNQNAIDQDLKQSKLSFYMPIAPGKEGHTGYRQGHATTTDGHNSYVIQKSHDFHTSMVFMQYSQCSCSRCITIKCAWMYWCYRKTANTCDIYSKHTENLKTPQF